MPPVSLLFVSDYPVQSESSRSCINRELGDFVAEEGVPEVFKARCRQRYEL